jgi:pimeloyl-ACP methyl ester carboxylesterase
VADFRGYGQSGHDLRADQRCASIAEAVRSSAPLVVMGQSLAVPPRTEAVRKSIEGGRRDPRGAFYDLGMVSRRGSHQRVHHDNRDVRPGDEAPARQAPLLVLHGALDTPIRPAEAAATFAAAASTDKQLVIVPIGHNDVGFSDVYWDALAPSSPA